MHHEDIKAAIRKQGVTPTDLARHLGVTQSLVSKVIRGKAKSTRVAEAISHIVGLPLADLWPSEYAQPARKPSITALLQRGAKRLTVGSAA